VTVNGAALVTWAEVITSRSSCGVPSGEISKAEGSSMLAREVVIGDWSAITCGL
jgi:hypothetical protein